MELQQGPHTEHNVKMEPVRLTFWGCELLSPVSVLSPAASKEIFIYFITFISSTQYRSKR